MFGKERPGGGPLGVETAGAVFSRFGSSGKASARDSCLFKLWLAGKLEGFDNGTFSGKDIFGADAETDGGPIADGLKDEREGNNFSFECSTAGFLFEIKGIDELMGASDGKESSDSTNGVEMSFLVSLLGSCVEEAGESFLDKSIESICRFWDL